jgi:hypothetical protein
MANPSVCHLESRRRRSADPISIKIRRTLPRSTAKNMPISAVRKLLQSEAPRRAETQDWPNRLKPFLSDKPNPSRFDACSALAAGTADEVVGRRRSCRGPQLPLCGTMCFLEVIPLKGHSLIEAHRRNCKNFPEMIRRRQVSDTVAHFVARCCSNRTMNGRFSAAAT